MIKRKVSPLAPNETAIVQFTGVIITADAGNGDILATCSKCHDSAIILNKKMVYSSTIRRGVMAIDSCNRILAMLIHATKCEARGAKVNGQSRTS